MATFCNAGASSLDFNDIQFFDKDKLYYTVEAMIVDSRLRSPIMFRQLGGVSKQSHMYLLDDGRLNTIVCVVLGIRPRVARTFKVYSVPDSKLCVKSTVLLVLLVGKFLLVKAFGRYYLLGVQWVDCLKSYQHLSDLYQNLNLYTVLC